MLSKPKLGIIGFSDGDPEVHKDLKAIIEEQMDAICGALEKEGSVEIVRARNLAVSEKDAKQEAEWLKCQGVDGTIFSYGVFAFPNFSAIAAKNGKGPFLLAANLNPDWPGMVAMLAAGGALHHLGISHYRAFGDFTDPAVLDKIVVFAKCAKTVSRLNGQKYGLFGGRSLGMYSSTVSMQDWQKLFGVDVDHIDQAEILRVAEEVPENQVAKAFEWLSENVGAIHYDGKALTPEKLKTQIRHYEATKKLAKEHEYDFVGVKCHYDMSKHYCTQCISAAFMNDPYDWNGEKEPIVFSCEADSDGALTMQMLKMLTDDPVIFMDVRHYDREYNAMVFCNCGSEATYYAAGEKKDYKKNLQKVSLYPALSIYKGGGCHVNFMTKSGKITIARLTRMENIYKMVIIPAEVIEVPREKMKETTEEWPHVYARLPFEYSTFLENFDANHCHAVYGDHQKELAMVCDMIGIPTETYQ